MGWWRQLISGHRPLRNQRPLSEFEVTLMLIADPEQLTVHFVRKLQELACVEEAFVYLPDREQSAETFARIDCGGTVENLPATLSLAGRTIQWFCTNQEFLLLDRDKELVDYLRGEIEPFLTRSVNLACPLVSMDRLVGEVFLRVPQTALDRGDLTKLRALFRQAGVAFENALLLEERLHQNERMLRAEQLATIGQFAAGMAHELRNPLTAIRSTVQFLACDFASGSEQQRLAEGLLGEVDRLDQIVGSLVALARPVDSSPQHVQVAEEILACVTFIETRGRSQGITLKTDLQDGIHKASCNSAELRQVLLNVIVNAFQAMPEGGTLSIKASMIDLGRNRILIEVADEGTGIPPDLRHRVFEPFFTTKPSGTGLGLAICSSIIKRYNGDIWIDQAEGGGTAVRIALPASTSISGKGTYREETESPDRG